MPTSKSLSDLQWVGLAASKDKTRPVLQQIVSQPNGSESYRHLVATDGYRLHVANSPQPEGAYALDGSKEEPNGSYPNWAYVMPDSSPNVRIKEREELQAVCLAAVAYGKALKQVPMIALEFNADGEFVTLNAGYVLDVLKAFDMMTPDVTVKNALSPVLFEYGQARRAVLMPVRLAAGSEGYASKRFKIDASTVEFIVTHADGKTSAVK